MGKVEDIMKLERYITPEYLKSQKALHDRPKGYGGRGDDWAPAVIDIMKSNNIPANKVLDYGCGQGTLAKAISKKLGQISEYDPAIRRKDFIEKYAEFDLVICTDVLEHIEPDRLAVVIEHIFDLSNKLVFLVIATRPSNKFFPDGRNVHLTIEPNAWWLDRISHPSFEFLEAPLPPLSHQNSRELVVLLKRKS